MTMKNHSASSGSASNRSPSSNASESKGKAKRAASLPSNSSEGGALAMYLADINRLPLLTVEEEQRLARAYRDQGDLDAAHKLVTSNLRFVVKVSYEYRSYGFKMADLIQEGNIGLMKAVQKFDADRQIRLISYGVWWIKAYIQNYILKNWSLVKLGTTQAQRKLFFSLARTKRELEKLGDDGAVVQDSAVAKKLHVKANEVLEMQQRLEGRDLSLDAPMGDEGGTSHLDFLDAGAVDPSEELATHEVRTIARTRVAAALARLDTRERYIIEQRLMNDEPMTLSELGAHYQISRERARQLEIRAKAKLRIELASTVDEIMPGEYDELLDEMANS
jgi:RNA polymerase sigma-32 factor